MMLCLPHAFGGVSDIEDDEIGIYAFSPPPCRSHHRSVAVHLSIDIANGSDGA